MYKAVESLQVGDAVTVSGTFEHCKAKGGLFNDGAIKSPEFDVRFTRVAPQAEN